MGLRTGLRVWVGGNNTVARREIESFLSETTRPPTGPLDVAFITPSTNEEAAYFAAKLKPRLTAEARVWVVVLDTDNPDGKSAPVTLSSVDAHVSGVGFARESEASVDVGFCFIEFSNDRGL